MYPMFIAWLGHRFRAEAAGPGGVMFALASLGGATLPWLVGAVSTRFTSLQAGLLIPLTSCLLMLAALPLAYRGPRVKAVSGGAPLNPSEQTKGSDRRMCLKAPRGANERDESPPLRHYGQTLRLAALVQVRARDMSGKQAGSLSGGFLSPRRGA